MAKPSSDDEKSPRYRTAYMSSRRTPARACGESKTKQSFRDECDINKKVKQFIAMGMLPSPKQSPVYGDVSSLDFQEAQLMVAKAKEAFEALPAKVRYRFRNRPGEMLAFLEDPANVEEGIKLGLLEKPPEKPPGKPPEPVKVDKATPPTPPSA